jgi:hypothetical protein
MMSSAGFPESYSPPNQIFFSMRTVDYPVFHKIVHYYLDRTETHEEDGQKITSDQPLTDILCQSQLLDLLRLSFVSVFDHQGMELFT